MKKEFEQFYNEIDTSRLSEAWKLAVKEKKIKLTIGLIIGAIVDIFIFYKLSQSYFFPIGLMGIYMKVVMCIVADVFVGLFVHLLVGGKKIKEYGRLFKELVIEEIFKNAFTAVDYVPNKQMPESVYEMVGYPYYYNRYYSDDYVDALIDEKYKIKMAEITTKKVTHHTDSHGHSHTSTVTIFSGLFAQIQLSKSIGCNLRIMQEPGKTKINMDSEEFDKHFQVDCSNRMKCYQILTHDIMDLLITFSKVLGKKYDVLIADDILYLRLHVGKMFETEISSKSMLNKNQIEKYYNIVDFMENLSKNIVKGVDENM